MDLSNFFSGQASNAFQFQLNLRNIKTERDSQQSDGDSQRLHGVDEEAAASAPSSEERDDSVEKAISGEIPEYESYENFHKLCVSSKYNGEPVLRSQWECLVERIKKQQTLCSFRLVTGVHVASLFHLCRELKTNFVVRFRALELYQRYLLLFSSKMGDYLKTCSEEDMDDFFKRYESQILLRMCTCILIASKLHTDTQVKSLRSEEIRDMLQTQGFKYSCKSVSNSEIRVLETLDYKCHWATPLDLVEQLLCLLTLKLKIFQRTHYYCVLLLEFCYSDWEKIRSKCSTLRERSSRVNEISTPLQCAGVVSAGLFIAAAESKEKNDLHRRVAEVAQLPEKDVQDLAIILLDLLNASP